MRIPMKELFGAWGIDEKTEPDMVLRSRLIANAYMLDCHTIGISHESLECWRKLSPFHLVFDIPIKGNQAHIDLPFEFVRFYGLDNPDTKSVLTINGKNLLIIVTSR